MIIPDIIEYDNRQHNALPTPITGMGRAISRRYTRYGFV